MIQSWIQLRFFSFKNKLLNITQYKSGRKNGFYFDYDKKGRIKEERYYKNDTLDGPVKIYFNGKIFSETIYKNGLSFYTKYFYKNGNIKSEYFNTYVEINNEKHPIDTLIKIYFKNGKIKKAI